MRQRTILIVDDNPDDCAVICRFLTRSKGKSYRILTVASGEEALERLHHETPDCLLLDFELPDMDGLAILTILKDSDNLQRFPVVMLTGFSTPTLAVEAMQRGAQDYLTKDTITAESLVNAIDNAMSKHLLRRLFEAQHEELKHKNTELETHKAALEIANAGLCAREALQTANEHLQGANTQLVMHGLRFQEQADELEVRNSELNIVNVQLEALATTDGMTGLKNHSAFQERLAEEYLRSLRCQTSLSVVLLDVDYFKHFNDTFGHPAGDTVLKKVAEVLQTTGRMTDLVARYGGEEFVLLLPETDEQGARKTAERIRHAIASTNWAQRAITVSVGAATFAPETNTAQTLVDLADKALYYSKQHGRNRVTHASELLAIGHQKSMHSMPGQDEAHHLRVLSKNAFDSGTLLEEEALLLTYESTIANWSRLLDLKDKETQRHSERVTELTIQLAQFMGMNRQEGRYARWGALLHDIGKIGIPDAILFKPGPLTEEEWSVMHRHPTLAYEMLIPSAFLHPALDIPYCHHEKWDGTGYPRGLKGEAIPFAARLFAVIDVYDALRSDRPYRAGWSKAKVREHLHAQSGTHFDPCAVEALLKMLEETEELPDDILCGRAA